MRKINKEISLTELQALAGLRFGDMVKAVVDIRRGIMAVDSELHADEESLLLDDGSRQEDLWGINIYPALKGEERIEFDSMINLRPAQGNRSRQVEDVKIRAAILAVVNRLVKE